MSENSPRHRHRKCSSQQEDDQASDSDDFSGLSNSKTPEKRHVSLPNEKGDELTKASGTINRSVIAPKKSDDISSSSPPQNGKLGNRVGFIENYGLYIIIGLLFAVIAIAAYPFFAHRDDLTVSYEGIDNVLRRQHSLFTSQDKSTWKTLRSVVKHVFKSANPEYPGVVLVAGIETARQTSQCLIRNIQKYFESHIHRTRDLNIDAKSFNARTVEDLKVMVDQEIVNVLQQVGPFLAINNLESLSPGAAMVFHSYCDNTNAQYKQVLFLLQLNIPDTSAPLSKQSVEEFLYDLWSQHLGEDKTAALMSRVANNIVIVVPESQEMLSKNC